MPQENNTRPAATNGAATLFSKLRDIQARLKAPKDQQSEEGWFYRSAEDILFNLKPILAELGLGILFKETPAIVGAWNYIVCEVILFDDAGNTLSTTTSVREQYCEPNRSASQITGSCISYAHKAVLSDLFALDNSRSADMVDPDAMRHDAVAPAGDGRPALYEGSPDWQREIQTIRANGENADRAKGRICSLYSITREEFGKLLWYAGVAQ